jgi:DNA replication protein DnaC
LAILSHAVVCSPCVEIAERAALDAWRSAAREGITQTVDAWLRSAGMSALEAAAELARVPTPLKRALPREDVQQLLDGAWPFVGRAFGLTGGQGIGKTMCLAALVKAWAVQRTTGTIQARTTVPADDEPATPASRGGSVRWVNLPQFAEQLKIASIQDRGAIGVDALVRSVSSASVLVIDDLGRERIARGGYDEDLATSALDRIVDTRARNALPIWWTANVGPTQLVARYGAAFTSRLLGVAPAIELPTLEDLRLTR